MRPRRRCSCDRQRVPRRRARVSGLCGFPDTAERVPAKYQKTGRCAAVQERCKNEKGDKMSTEFYCEEFPTEQNGKPVQTLKDLLEACPEDGFHFMTPVGYVDLTAQDAGQLRQHHTIWQEASARDFSSSQGLESEGILYVFRAFQTAELAEKIRRGSKTNCAVLP